jgi:hypothetical protein
VTGTGLAPSRPPVPASTSKTFPPAAQAFVIGVILLGALAIGLSANEFSQKPIGWMGEWTRLAMLVLVSAWISVRLPNIDASVSISDTFVFMGALVFGASAGTLLALLGSAVLATRAAWHHRRTGQSMPWQQTAFNLTAAPVSLWSAAHLARLQNPSASSEGFGLALVLTLAVLWGTYYLLSTGALAVAIGLQQRANVVAVWWRHFRELGPMLAAAAALAGLLGVQRQVDFAFLLLILPLLLVIHMANVWRAKSLDLEARS